MFPPPPQTNRSRNSITLVCVGAVQLPVQRSDDGGQIRADAFFTEVHGYRSHELKHTRSLQRERVNASDAFT